MKEKSRRRIARDQARRDPRSRVANAEDGPVDGKTPPEPAIDTADEEPEAELGVVEHEESRRILGYDE